LHNTYYDTPEHALKGQGMALRVRQFGDAAQPHWVQTLKIGGAANSALSRRGEWEEALPSNALDASLLQDTPWAAWDPKWEIFNTLTPVFTTVFERLSWVAELPQGRVDIALDRGEVLMDGQRTPLCELEIELLQGDPEAVFEAADAIAQHLALLPAHISKAERAYRLVQGTVYAPLRAKPPALSDEMPFAQVAQAVLRECFLQFTANLNSLQHSDAPEILHQARIGWRRLRSMLKMLQLQGESRGFPRWEALKPLLQGMTILRDLDVAATEVLPLYANAYQAGDIQRMAHWAFLEGNLQQARVVQLDAVRTLLATPAVGRTLLHMTHWLETEALQAPDNLRDGKPEPLRKWLKKRVGKLVATLDAMPLHSKDPLQQHAMRILCKRLRYSVESLRPLLPRKKAEHWHHHATRRQTQIGVERDRLRALQLAQQLHAAEGLVEFLRGAAFGASV